MAIPFTVQGGQLTQAALTLPRAAEAAAISGAAPVQAAANSFVGSSVSYVGQASSYISSFYQKLTPYAPGVLGKEMMGRSVSASLAMAGAFADPALTAASAAFNIGKGFIKTGLYTRQNNQTLEQAKKLFKEDQKAEAVIRCNNQIAKVEESIASHRASPDVISPALKAGASAMTGTASSAAGAVKSGLWKVGSAATTIPGYVGSGVSAVVRSVVAIPGAVKAIPGAVTTAAYATGHAIKAIPGTVKNGAGMSAGAIGKGLWFAGKTAFAVPGATVRGVARLVSATPNGTTRIIGHVAAPLMAAPIIGTPMAAAAIGVSVATRVVCHVTKSMANQYFASVQENNVQDLKHRRDLLNDSLNSDLKDQQIETLEDTVEAIEREKEVLENVIAQEKETIQALRQQLQPEQSGQSGQSEQPVEDDSANNSADESGNNVSS